MNHRRCRGVQGWALPLLCLVILIGALILTVTVQRVLLERTRWTQDDLLRLQAHALAEGALHRALALLEDSRAVSAECHPQNPPTPMGLSFAARHARPGGWVPCRVSLAAQAGAEAWRCDCQAAAPAVPETPRDSESAPPVSAWVELTFSGEPAHLTLTATARLPKATGPTPATALSAMASPTSALSRSSLVRLRQDSRGVWREVVGSWRDDTP